jgi:hypothetical protein
MLILPAIWTPAHTQLHTIITQHRIDWRRLQQWVRGNVSGAEAREGADAGGGSGRRNHSASERERQRRRRRHLKTKSITDNNMHIKS